MHLFYFFLFYTCCQLYLWFPYPPTVTVSYLFTHFAVFAYTLHTHTHTDSISLLANHASFPRFSFGWHTRKDFPFKLFLSFSYYCAITNLHYKRVKVCMCMMYISQFFHFSSSITYFFVNFSFLILIFCFAVDLSIKCNALK